MSSSAEAASPAAPRTELVDRLRERLERAESLSTRFHEALKQADAERIREATDKLETLALEFKLLHAEYRKVPDDAPAEPSLERARGELENVATRLARGSAANSALLERLISVSRGLADSVRQVQGDSYVATGEPQRPELPGLRLRREA